MSYKIALLALLSVGGYCDAVLAEPFSAKSGSINVGCEENGSASVVYNAPVAKRITSANARWIDAVMVSSQSVGNVVISTDGQHANASGGIRGVNRDHLPLGITNCPGGGHATLELFGEIQ